IFLELFLYFLALILTLHMSKPPIVGIDLGTTNSCISIMRDGKPEIIANQEGFRTTPSIVNISTDINGSQKVTVGQKAEKLLISDPQNTISNAKRLLGRSYEEIGEYAKKLPFKLEKDGESVKIQIANKFFTPSEISAFVLEKLKTAAEKYINKPIKYAVITVPAYFNHNQREETRKAGESAGLKVLRVLNEPTSAALNHQISGTIAVYDLGGGTFDISILEKADNIFEVKATSGDSFLGGDDIDNLMTDFLLKKYNLDDSKRPLIKNIAEKAKKELSTHEKTTLEIPNGESFVLTREHFETLVRPIIEKTILPCKKALRDANLKNVDHLVLVGGMTKMPLVRKISSEIFKQKPLTTLCPDESVAQGAAIQGAILAGDVKKLLLDVTSLSLGIETVGGLMSTIVKRNTTLPLRKSSVFTTSEDNQQEVIINIYQGEDENVNKNTFLGKIVLKDIPPLPRGVPKIEIGFEADVNGIYRVTAKDLLTDKQQSAEVTGIKTKEDEVFQQLNQKNPKKSVFEMIKQVFY
ncbi:mitochondrial type heat shock protein 70, partial [Pseudoloma neurophilia]